jgi:sugar lactone lactonase YvrE
MILRDGRYPPTAPVVAEGWALERLTPAARLYCANGMRAGPDGRLYVTQVSGSQISAIDPDSGAIEDISPVGGDIVSPDDLVFDACGDMYVTEYMEGRVSVRSRGGAVRVLRDDLPGANGITLHQGRLFVDECRVGGRLLELDLAGGAPRVLLEDLPLPNALAPGPDGKLYYPVMAPGEIWRIDPDGGTPERVTGGLDGAVAVKFDAAGRIVAPSSNSGDVVRIDIRSGAREVLANVGPGLDNLAFVGERLFVSHMTDGRVTEILPDGRTRALVPAGLQRPMGLTVGEDGALYVADNVASYRWTPGEGLQLIARMFSPGAPGGIRDWVPAGEGAFLAATTGGRVALFRPFEPGHDLLAEGIDQPYGVALAPGGEALVAEFGAGRLLAIEAGRVRVVAEGLREPMGVAMAPDGSCLVAECGAGRVVRATSSGVETVLEGLSRPQGLAVRGETLVVVDAGARSVVALDLATGARATLAGGLPIGAPEGVTPKPLKGAPPYVGPLGPFAGIAAHPDGTLYVAGDGEGTVLALRPAPLRRPARTHG